MKPMKILYIESKLKNQELDISNEEISKLPKKLFLAYSIQYKDLALKIKQQLEKNKIKISKMQQVLGCSKIQTKDPLLLIGQGRFHALNLYLQAQQVFIFENNQILKIQENEINSLKNKRKTALLKFLSSKKIGILVTTKPGQESINLAIRLKENLNKKGKQSFIFVSNNIPLNQFENFNIGSWVNTVCPGLSYDNPNIINHREIPNSKDF